MVCIKIYGETEMSTCTKRVAVVCNEIGIKYEIAEVDPRKGQHKAEEYVRNVHPFGVVPALEDEDGTRLYESRAICRYITTKYGKDSGLLSRSTGDLKAYGLFEQAASVEYSSFDPSAGGLAYEVALSRQFGSGLDETMIQKHMKALAEKMEGYENILSKQRYLGGNSITLADLSHLPYGAVVNQVAPEIMLSKPSVKAWWEDISSRPWWRAIRYCGLQNILPGRVFRRLPELGAGNRVRAQFLSPGEFLTCL